RHDLTVDGVVHTRRGGDRDRVGRTIEGRSTRGGERAGLTGDDDGRLGLRQGTRQAGLHEVLVLVEVDVEVLEERDLATGVRTHRVVDQVDDDAEQARNVVEHLDRNDLLDAQGGREGRLGVVETTAHLVLLQEEVGQERVGRVQRRGARAAVVDAGTRDL